MGSRADEGDGAMGKQGEELFIVDVPGPPAGAAARLIEKPQLTWVREE